jgi:PilZ domain-containing protein
MPRKATLLQIEKTAVDNRRVSSRMPGSGILLVRPEGSGKPLARSGRIVDFSKSGIALLLNVQYACGTNLSLSPIGWDRSSSLEARVVHCKEVDGLWLHGCEFVQKLNRKDMEHFFSFNLKVS